MTVRTTSRRTRRAESSPARARSSAAATRPVGRWAPSQGRGGVPGVEEHPGAYGGRRGHRDQAVPQAMRVVSAVGSAASLGSFVVVAAAASCPAVTANSLLACGHGNCDLRFRCDTRDTAHHTPSHTAHHTAHHTARTRPGRRRRHPHRGPVRHRLGQQGRGGHRRRHRASPCGPCSTSKSPATATRSWPAPSSAVPSGSCWPGTSTPSRSPTRPTCRRSGSATSSTGAAPST